MKTKYKKGDKKKFFGIGFTYNGSYWVMDYIEHIKIRKKYFCEPPNITYCKQAINPEFDCILCKWRN